MQHTAASRGWHEMLEGWLRGTRGRLHESGHDSGRCARPSPRRQKARVAQAHNATAYIRLDMIATMKPLRFLGDSLKALLAFPEEARQDAGFQLDRVQTGRAAR